MSQPIDIEDASLKIAWDFAPFRSDKLSAAILSLVRAAVEEERERECDRVLTEVARDIGGEYAAACQGGWRSTQEALERLQDKLDSIRARRAGRVS